MTGRFNYVRWLGALVLGVTYLLSATSGWSKVRANIDWEIVNRNGKIGINLTCQIWNCGENGRLAYVQFMDRREKIEYYRITTAGGIQCQNEWDSGQGNTLAFEEDASNLPTFEALGEYEVRCIFRAEEGHGFWNGSFHVDHWPSSTIIKYPGPPEAPTVSLQAQVENSDEVLVNITTSSNAFDSESLASGYAEPTGFRIWRKLGDEGRWRTIEQRSQYVANQSTSQRYIDREPWVGKVWYGVQQRNIHTDLRNIWGERSEVAITIPALPINNPPQNLRMNLRESGWDLVWAPPIRNRVFGIKTYQVYGGPAAIQPLPLLGTVGSGSRLAHLIRDPDKGVAYAFQVQAHRDAVQSPISELVRFGTESAPTVFEEDRGPGWVQVGWHAGPDTGNGLPRHELRWNVRWVPTSLVPAEGAVDPADYTVVEGHGNNNVRSIVFNVNNSSLRDVNATYDDETYRVEVTAFNAAGTGEWGTMTTSAIVPLRAAPARGMSTEIPFGPDGDDLMWRIEGPSEISPGDTAIYVLRATLRTGASRTAPPSSNDRSIRPVGIREIHVDGEDVNNNREIKLLDSPADNCGRVAAFGTGAHRLCIWVADADGNRYADIGSTSPDGAEEAYVAYQVYGGADGGVPHNHRMVVQVRDYSIYPLVGRKFKVGLGIRDGGQMVFREDSSRGCSLGSCDDRFMEVTIVKADPLPPTKFRVLSVQREADDVPIWDVSWEPPHNAEAAQVDETDYRVYRRAIGDAQFTVVADDINRAPPNRIIRRSKMEWIKETTPTAFETYVVAVSGPAGSQTESERSSIVRIGFPEPPHSVHAVGGNGLVTVSWEAPSNPTLTITGYRVEYASDRASTSWGTLPAVDSDTRRVVHSGRGVRETVYYRVVSLVADAESAPSTVETATTTGSASTFPAKPANPIAQAAARDQIVIRWDPPADAGQTGVHRYRVERSAGGTPNEAWQQLSDTVTETHYIDTALAAGATWHYRVLAIGGLGAGSRSDVVSASTIHADAPEAPPRLLTARSVSGGSVTLSWLTPQVTGESAIVGYRVERAVPDAVIWAVLVEDTGNVSTAYTDYSVRLSAGDVILYRVSAINAQGPGVPVSTEAATQSANFDFTHANFNADGQANEVDAAILYYALSYQGVLGDGTEASGGMTNVRRRLLVPYRGNNAADPSGLRDLIANAHAWSETNGLRNGGDLNQDGAVDVEDAMIWYYAQTYSNEIGRGDADSGSATLRRAFLGGLAGNFDGRNDTVLRGFIIHARAIAIP